MTTEGEMDRMLHELAAQAPPATAIRAGATLERIRQARRRRQAATATLSVVATASVVAVVAFLASWVGGPDRVIGQPPATAPQQPQTPVSQSRPASAGQGRCAAQAGGGMNASSSPLVMSMSGEPVELSAAEGTPLLPIVVTNRSAGSVTGVTSVQPELVLVREGQAVTAPAGARSAGVEFELAPGASHTFRAPLSLASCDAAGPAPEAPSKVSAGAPAGPTVGPGTYLMYATQTFQLRDADHPGGYLLEVRGGPWQVVLR